MYGVRFVEVYLLRKGDSYNTMSIEVPWLYP